MEIETQNKGRDLAKRVQANEPYTIDELRDAIHSRTGDRMAELEATPKAKKSRAKVEVVDLSGLLP